MANIRRQMIDMENAHADEIQMWRYAIILVGIVGFGAGIISHMVIG